MRSLRTLLVALVLVGIASIASAQAATLTWTAPDNTVSSAEAAGLIYTLYVNNVAGAALATVTCGVPGPPFNCTAPVPPATPLSIGTKLELTAKTATSAESPKSVPFISSPTAPTNFRRQ